MTYQVIQIPCILLGVGLHVKDLQNETQLNMGLYLRFKSTAPSEPSKGEKVLNNRKSRIYDTYEFILFLFTNCGVIILYEDPLDAVYCSLCYTSDQLNINI